MHSPWTIPVLLAALAPLPAVGDLEPGKPMDYSKLAFYPDRWEQRGHELELIPWEGKQVAFLTIADGLDPKTMTALVDALALLFWRFAEGDSPPDPGPSECGVDPTDDDVECETDSEGCE